MDGGSWLQMTSALLMNISSYVIWTAKLARVSITNIKLVLKHCLKFIYTCVGLVLNRHNLHVQKFVTVQARSCQTILTSQS